MCVSGIAYRRKMVFFGCFNYDSLYQVTFADFEYEKEFDSSFLGHADLVVEQRICDDDVLLIKGTKNTNKVSIFCMLV